MALPGPDIVAAPVSKRRKKIQRKSQRRTSDLAAHRRRGRVLQPPLAALPNMRAVNWLPDLFPDMLWLTSIISYDEDGKGMIICARTLDLVDRVLRNMPEEARPPEKLIVDGRLSSFEPLASAAREAVLAEMESQGVYDLAVPEPFFHALGMYPNAPGSWLLGVWRARGVAVDWERAQGFLAGVIADAAHGQSEVPTRAKFIALSRWFKAGRIRVPRDMTELELFPKYPDRLNEDEKAMVESVARAMFMSIYMPEMNDNVSPDWPMEFWRSNWQKYPCTLEEAAAPDTGSADSIQEALNHFQSQADTLLDRVMTRATAVDPDLYSPDRYEVLAGIMVRSVRSLVAASRTPLLWSAEHGFPLLRQVCEALIVLRWLLSRDDPALYTRFKSYGRGRLKLLKLHVEQYLDSLDDPPPELRQYRDFLDAEVNQDVWEEWQEISLDSTFSGLSAYKMAQEVGMESEYNFVFAPASAATHGEWSSLDRYALERCLNPLHRWHRVPRREAGTRLDPELIDSALRFGEELVDAFDAGISPRPDLPRRSM